MPRDFNGSVEPPKDIQFGADKLVDTSNPIEGLDQSLKGLAAATGTLVTRKLQNDLLAEDALEESRAGDIRKTKKALYDAADRRDEVAVGKFGKQLEELTIAETQGAISGTNASIRKESLLRSYLNRFPHREEEIRQTYSSTRAALQAQRASKVSDPIEDGINDVLQEAVKKGKSPIQVLEDRQHEDFMHRASLDAQYNAALGQEVSGKVEQAFDEHAMPLFYSKATDYIQHSMQDAQSGRSDVDAMTIKRNLEMMKQADMLRVSGTLNNIVAAGDDPGAVLPAGFRERQLKKVADLYDGLIKYTDNIDTLTAYARGLTYQKNATIAELRNTDPLIRMGIDIGAPEAMFQFLAKEYPTTAAVKLTQGVAGLQALLKAAPTPMEKARIKFQIQMLGAGYSGEEQAADLKEMLQNGAPPPRTGDNYVDGVRLSALSEPILKSSEAPQEYKDKVGISIMEAEKQDASYLGPGKHWYTNPTHLNALSRSETLKTRMREETTGVAASVTRKLTELPQVASGLMFTPNLEADMQEPKFPWRAYSNGGPFSFSGEQDAQKKVESTGGDPRMKPAMDTNPMTGNLSELKKITDALNNSYWIIRRIDGAASAEEWASQILSQRDADQEANEKDKAESDEPFDKPSGAE